MNKRLTAFCENRVIETIRLAIKLNRVISNQVEQSRATEWKQAFEVNVVF
ncbi:hypothetical protein J2TS4_35850 [Paenibacillus sp. J2TS4]|nr:hypothetical protein J2TS4_35850 [Paenibacillus sp. J2TS4]